METLETDKEYPKISPEFVEVVLQELHENEQFYTRVIDLMNRLNIAPPSHQMKKPVSRNRGTQTRDNELEEQLSLKRKITDELFKVKAKKILNSVSKVKFPEKNSAKNTKQFEAQKIVDKKISVSIGSFQLPEGTKEIESTPKPEKRPKTPHPEDLKSNQIPFKQLIDIPVFKNYQKGDKNQKLYIKNLSKDVTEEDLLGIYGRFTEDPSSIYIKLMQHGRMKGQAFVTFTACRDNELFKVEEALNSTLGFILRKKPMVVCYGKK
ncbi:RNPC3 family protein [Megaselia abdita]